MIVTVRARLILLLACASAMIGLVDRIPFLVQFGLATILWIGIEWVVFRYRADSITRRVSARREITDRQGPARMLWLGRPAHLSTTLNCKPSLRWMPATLATFSDLLPMGATCPDHDSAGKTVAIRRRQECLIEHPLETSTVGAIRFAGIRCILHDQHGFFQAERFIPLPQKMRVLPLSQKLGTPTTIRKPRNAMPPPGIHSNSKAGAGSELLEIRDYIPGDPPKSIAWKVSARRDVLMTKEFESEVPVRSQMFVDMSPAVRLGYPGPCLANRLVEVATTVSNLLVSHRDSVGLSVFDGHEVHLTKSSASRRARLQMMDLLATSIDKPISPVDVPVYDLLRPAFDVVRVRYPAAVHFAQNVSHRRLLPRTPTQRMREGLSAVIASHYGLDELAMGELAVDDRRMSYWLQRFLSDHQIPYVGTRYSQQGEYLFDDSAKIQQLAKLITHAAARSRDSELFLVFAELCDAEYDLGPLASAIKLAIARKHRVAVLCAWPTGMSLTEQAAPHASEFVVNASKPDLDWLLEQRQRGNAFSQLRAELGKLRVPVAIATDQLAIPLIAAQLDIVRAGRSVA